MAQFADQASSIVTPIVENVQIARDTMRLRVAAPEMAASVTPGQFFMLRNPSSNDPLIGRAFALYDRIDEPTGASTDWIDLVYVVKGKLTTSVAGLGTGADVALWGPLGNGFPVRQTEHLVMVAGGIGQTPFLTLAREALGSQSFGRDVGYAKRVTFCYGARTADYLAGVEQFEQAGCEVHLATEDGSRSDGTQGKSQRVTDVLNQVLNESGEESLRIVCCGPEPMMEAVADIARARNKPCEVSLETPMACGIGICFTCVAKIKCDEDWDYKRTCVEGPVFDAAQVLWH